jgi:hypothetical protein
MSKLRLCVALLGASLLSAPAAFAGDFSSVSLTGAKKLSEFKAVHVAPVQLALEQTGGYRRGGNSARPIDETSAQHKAVDLQREFLEAVVGKLGLSKVDGPGILTITATLTKLEPNGRTVEDYKGNAGLSPMSSSKVEGEGAAVRIELSENGQSLGVISDDYDDSLTQKGDGVWEEVDRAFEKWASELVEVISSN